MGVIDPQTWADAEDGRALRELLAVLHPTDFLNILSPNELEGSWYIDAQCAAQEGDTFKETADALRAALVKR